MTGGLALRAALLLCGAALSAAAPGAGLKSGAFDPPRMAPGFVLKGSKGGELSLKRYRGKVVALAFGYTFCPDVCPTTLLELAQVRKSLGAQAADFQVIYITVDPERDTPEQLRKWLAFFDPSFIGGSGSPAQLAAVRKEYGVTLQKQTPAGTKAAYLIHHSSSVYLIDRQGRLRAMMPFGGSAEDFTHDVALLLKEGKR